MTTSVSEVLDRIAPETDPTPDWEWVLVQAAVEPERAGHVYETGEPGSSGLRNVRRLRRLTLLGAGIVVAAAVALVVVAPWKGGPTILQRANAAISPAASQVLYMNFGICCPEAWRSGRDHIQLWIDGAAPRSFRSAGQPMFGYTEHGGTLGPETSLGTQSVTSYLGYNPTTNTIVEHVRSFDRSKPLDFDPLTVVRKALTAGTAHLDGRAVIDGEQAIKITLTTRDLNGHTGTVIYLANAKTYYPIEIKLQSLEAFSYPLEPLFRPNGRGWTATFRFQSFEYLDTTTKNLALTNIQAQHPNTKIIRCNGYKCTVIRNQPKGAHVSSPAKARQKHSAVRGIPPKDILKIAPLIRTCMSAQGATSVTPNHPGASGGIAHFPGVKHPFAWSWVNSSGKAKPIPNPMSMPPARDHSAPAIRERHAINTCLVPYRNKLTH